MSRKGTQLGRYTLGDEIGSGAFASVYRAHDEGLEADVAIKILAENHAGQPEVRERFLSEGRFLRRVDHPNVIRVYDVGETADRQPYLVLQLANGGTLGERLDDPATVVTEADVFGLADALSSALGALHTAELVHRDLSPHNIFFMSPDGRSAQPHPNRLIGDNERIVVGDLGLSKDLAAGSGLTAGAGTGKFAAPEQRTAFGQVTAASDVYGASALLKHVAAEVALPSDLLAGLDEGLAHDPNQRPATIAAWRAGLGTPARAESVEETTGPTEVALTSAQADETVRPAAERSRTGLRAGLALALAALVVLAVVVFQSGGNDDQAATTNTTGTSDAAADIESDDSFVIFRDGTRPNDWSPANWGNNTQVSDDGEAQIGPSGGISFDTSTNLASPVEIGVYAYVVFRGDNLDAPGLVAAVRANDSSNAAMEPCGIRGTDMLTSSVIVVPTTYLGVSDAISRIALMHRSNDPSPTFSLSSIALTNTPPFEPADSCA